MRDTTTGLKYEQRVSCKLPGIDLSKHKLYSFLKEKNILWENILSRRLLPDEAYYNLDTQTLSIFEKKYQQTEGSADEKPQTCGFKIWEYNKIGKVIGAKKLLILIFSMIGLINLNITIC